MDTVTAYADSERKISLALTSDGIAQNLSSIISVKLHIGAVLLDSETHSGVFDWFTDPYALVIRLSGVDTLDDGRYDGCILSYIAVDAPDTEVVWTDNLTVMLGMLPPHGMLASELMESVVPRLGTTPRMNIIDAVNAVTSVLFRHLMEKRSDLVRSTLWLTVPSGTNGKALPAGFRGLAEQPVAGGRVLQPLPKNMLAKMQATSGIPVFYRVTGSILELFPVPDSDTAILLSCWHYPGNISSMADIIPFCGIFDDLYRELVALLCSSGSTLLLTSDQAVVLAIRDAVDGATAMRVAKRVEFVQIPTGVQKG